MFVLIMLIWLSACLAELRGRAFLGSGNHVLGVEFQHDGTNSKIEAREQLLLRCSPRWYVC
jgi:hypothetical protein